MLGKVLERVWNVVVYHSPFGGSGHGFLVYFVVRLTVCVPVCVSCFDDIPLFSRAIAAQ